MKILVLSNGYPPDPIVGNDSGIAEVVEALQSKGHDLLVLTSALAEVGQAPSHVDRRLSLVDEWNPNTLGNNPLHQRAMASRSRFVDARNVAELGCVIQRFRPDVAYLGNLLGLGGLGLVASLQHQGVPWVWRLEGDAPIPLCQLRNGVIPGLAEAFSKRLQGAFLIASETVRRRAEALGIRLNGTVRLLPFWIGGEPHKDRLTRARGGPLRLIALGGARRGDGLDRLVGAARRLIDGGDTNFSIDLFGPIEHHAPLAMVASQGLVGHLRLAGPRSPAEYRQLFHRYDALAFPTDRPGAFTRAPIEAAASGCLPILSGDSAAAEWLVHGVHCLKTDSSAQGLAELLRLILRGTIDLGPIARRASVTAWRDFHLDALPTSMETTLLEAAKKRRTPMGSLEDLHRLARIAEHLSLAWIEESLSTDTMINQAG